MLLSKDKLLTGDVPMAIGDRDELSDDRGNSGIDAI